MLATYRTILLAAAAGACAPGETVVVEPASTRIVDGDPVGVAVATAALGPADPLRVWHVNAVGARVPGPALTLTIDGAPVSVDIGGDGVGTLLPGAPGPHRVAGPSGEEVVVFVHEAAWTTPSLDAGVRLAQAPSLGASHAGAMLFAAGGDVVAVDPSGAVEPVVSLPVAVEGMVALALDDDGLRDDLVVWGGSTVVVLGGPSRVWRTGFRAEGRAARGVGAGDLDLDGVPDLAIAWAGASDRADDLVEWWRGTPDGLTTGGALVPPAEPTGLGMNEAQGGAVLTVLMDDAWLRLQRAGDTLVDVGPDATVILDARMDARTGDFDGDGVADLAAISRPDPAQSTRAVVALLGGGVSITDRTYSGAAWALADADGDGADDLVFVEASGAVKRYGFADGQAREWSLGSVVASGPIGVAAPVGGGLAWLGVADGDAVRLYPGSTSENASWRPRERARIVLGALVPSRLLTWTGHEASGGFVAVTTDGGRVVIGTYAWGPWPTADVSREGATVLGEGEALRDVAVCGDEAVVLTDQRLLRVDLIGAAHDILASQPATTGSRVACSTADGFAAAWLDGGTVKRLDDALDVVETLDRAGAVDVAIVSAGTSAPAVDTCGVPACRVTGWSVGGVPAFVVDAEGALAVRGAAGSGPLPVYGETTVGDVDGDGDDDLVIVDAQGTVYALRAAGSAVAPVALRHRHGVFASSGPVALTDVNEDGLPELLGVNDAGAVIAWVARP